MRLTWDMLAPHIALYGLCYLITAVVSYLLGCFNGAIVVSKYILRDDIRNHGSGNAGLTNFHRVFGAKLAALVILSDALKGVLAALFGRALCNLVGSPTFGMLLAALFCVLGHMFPVMFGFRGGKGILTGGVIALLLDWRIALLVWGAFLLVTALTRWVSLGSICAAFLFPVGIWLFWPRLAVYVVPAALIGALMIWKHRGNISRILDGTEPKLTFHGNKEGSS